MRSAALCLLAISTSACNGLLDLDPTLLGDGGSGPPTDGPLPTARLTYMVALTTPQSAPAASLELPPISPAPTVQIGRIAESLTDATISSTGEIQIPYEFADSPWRLVYQLANDIPREVHWTPVIDREQHAIVPLFGRVDRAPIPGPNTTMTINAAGVSGTHVGPRMFTTGVWTESQPVFPVPPGTAFTYNLNSSTQLSGPPGAPDHSMGDHVILADFATTGSCRSSTGSAAATLALTDGPSTIVSAQTWVTNPTSMNALSPTFDQKLRAALLAGSSNPADATTVIQIGKMPSARMPGFSYRNPQVGLRTPVMLVMLQCTGDDLKNLPMVHFPSILADFPTVAHLQLSADRVLGGGLRLPHGIAVIQPANPPLTFAFPVGAASPPFMLGTDDIGTTDNKALTPGTGPLTFSFVNEPMAMPADYYEIVLHRVQGSSAIPERGYTVVDPSLTIEREILSAATDYVFEVRAYLGAPDARMGDFRQYLSTQSSAVTWTHTFRTP